MLAFALGLLGCGSNSVVETQRPATVVSGGVWAGAWGVAPSSSETVESNSGGSDQTFRFLIYPTIGGRQERVRFSNAFGLTPVTIANARLAIGADGSPSIDPAHDVPLTFSGSASVTLQPGQILSSDTVAVTYNFGQWLSVSMYVKGSFPPLTGHNSLFVTNYSTAAGSGDKTADAAGAGFSTTQDNWLLLSGLDVYGDYQGTVVLIGASTTDGFKSNYGNSNAYPSPNSPVEGQHTSRLSDQLAILLNAAGIHLGVVNAGISGDTVSPPSNAAASHIQDGPDRFNRDVVQQTNVKVVVDYLGGIDLRGVDCKSALEVEAATQQLVMEAAAAKIPMILATIPPSDFCVNPSQPNFGPSPSPTQPYAGGPSPGPQNGGEIQRIAYDNWIRSTGIGLPGVFGIADMDQAARDPANPDFLLPTLNSGDNYHPNGSGYQVEAGAIPLSLLQAAAK